MNVDHCHYDVIRSCHFISFVIKVYKTRERKVEENKNNPIQQYKTNMEECLAVEKEIDRVLTKFGSINEHAERVLTDLISYIEGLKEELQNGLYSLHSLYLENLLLNHLLNCIYLLNVCCSSRRS